MSAILGIALACDSVRLVALRDGKVAWAAERQFEDDGSIEQVTFDLLAEAAPGAGRKRLAVVAIGPSRAQTKRLRGLPAVSDPRALSAIVAESAGSFFVKNGIPLATTSVFRDETGDVWGAAIDDPPLRAVLRACVRARVRVEHAVPTLAVLGYAVSEASVRWRDGEFTGQGVYSDGVLHSARRASAGIEGDDPLTPVGALAALGPHAPRFADAFGAAVAVRRPTRLAITTPNRERAPDVPRWRLAVASAAFVVALAAGATIPAVSMIRQAREDRATIARLAPLRVRAAVAERDLGRVSSALGTVDDFRRQRRLATLLLSELAQALPDPVQLVALRTDSAGGTLVALAPRATDVLSQLERIRVLAAPEVVGPVTRETVGDRERERVTVRFSWADARGSA